MATIGNCWQTTAWVSTGGWAEGVWGSAVTRGGTSYNRFRVLMQRLKKRREEQRQALLRRRR